MILSQYLLPTLKETPVEAVVTSHKLMLRAGMIKQIASGLYDWLPLGLNVLKKIKNIVRKEMNKSGASEVLIPCIQPISLWQKSGRYGINGDLMQETLKIQDRNKNNLLFTPTAEEAICDLFSHSAKSYKDLPKNLYQIGIKFRDEIRPRYGVMRSREFLMKDSYSFDLTEKDAMKTYDRMLKTYLHIFKRLGLVSIPVAANSGDIGGDCSHEFHILSENTGESTIYYDKRLLTAIEDSLNNDNNDNNDNDGNNGINDNVIKHNFGLDDLGKFYANEEERHDLNTCNVPQDMLQKSKSIEVGHIFYLGTKYSSAMNVKIQSPEGTLINPLMGCYGIGISRLVGAIIESSHDDRGIIWPMSIAPFKCVVINLSINDKTCVNVSNNIYIKLSNAGVETLLDDTDQTPGFKFANMDLIGIPLQIIVGKKGIENNNTEVKIRHNGKKVNVCIDDTVNYICKLISKLNTSKE